MARNTTRQGANFELDIMHYLDGTMPDKWGPGFGYTSLRSSGSRGAIDVIAIGPPAHYMSEGTSDVLFIQAKRNKPYLSPIDRARVQHLALRAGAVPLLASMAKDLTTGRVRPHFWLLTGMGPNDKAPWEPERNEL